MTITRAEIRSLATVLCSAILAGCTQQPDAIRLTVTPEKETFVRSEPVVVRTHLVGTDGNAALHKSFFYAMELSREGKVVGTSGDQPAFCGTGIIETIPFQPFILVGSLFDVGDLSGRFMVLTKGKECSQKVLVRPDSFQPDNKFVFEPRNYMKNANNDTPWEKRVLSEQSLAPGRYHLRVRLINKRSDSNPLISSLPPLFWKPYEPAIEAETELTVSE